MSACRSKCSMLDTGKGQKLVNPVIQAGRTVKAASTVLGADRIIVDDVPYVVRIRGLLTYQMYGKASSKRPF